MQIEVVSSMVGLSRFGGHEVQVEVVDYVITYESSTKQTGSCRVVGFGLAILSVTGQAIHIRNFDSDETRRSFITRYLEQVTPIDQPITTLTPQWIDPLSSMNGARIDDVVLVEDYVQLISGEMTLSLYVLPTIANDCGELGPSSSDYRKALRELRGNSIVDIDECTDTGIGLALSNGVKLLLGRRELNRDRVGSGDVAYFQGPFDWYLWDAETVPWRVVDE